MSDDVQDLKIYVNGIDGTTGQYLLDLDLEKVAALARGRNQETSVRNWLTAVWRKLTTPTLGLPATIKPEDVSKAGWAVVFHRDESDDVKKALQPLIEHRAKTVTDSDRLKVLDYLDGEDWSSWLARHGVSAGTILPKKVPFYILLVGSPERIPFSFAYLLDVEYAVGRLHFDTASEYAAYVESLIDYETSAAVPNSKEAVFFAPRHEFDPATQLSAELLVKPLLEGTEEFQPITSYGQFRSRELLNGNATKQALVDTFHPASGMKPPAFLFSASHGMGFPLNRPDLQSTSQGALLCQDWPGFGQIGPEYYFAAADVKDDAYVHGMIAFHFACYGAGTPAFDRFIYNAGTPPQIAEKASISPLPKRLLAHPKGAALAVIGHVERAWGFSILGRTSGPQLNPFQNSIMRILEGRPIGLAMKDFNTRYAALSTNLADLQDKIRLKFKVSDSTLGSTWMERNDAEGYVVLGDPAVALRVKDLV
jgi:hypothetical protein